MVIYYFPPAMGQNTDILALLLMRALCRKTFFMLFSLFLKHETFHKSAIKLKTIRKISVQLLCYYKVCIYLTKLFIRVEVQLPPLEIQAPAIQESPPWKFSNSIAPLKMKVLKCHLPPLIHAGATHYVLLFINSQLCSKLKVTIWRQNNLETAKFRGLGYFHNQNTQQIDKHSRK